jgi:hypothetical protein
MPGHLPKRAIARRASFRSPRSGCVGHQPSHAEHCPAASCCRALSQPSQQGTGHQLSTPSCPTCLASSSVVPQPPQRVRWPPAIASRALPSVSCVAERRPTERRRVSSHSRRSGCVGHQPSQAEHCPACLASSSVVLPAVAAGPLGNQPSRTGHASHRRASSYQPSQQGVGPAIRAERCPKSHRIVKRRQGSRRRGALLPVILASRHCPQCVELTHRAPRQRGVAHPIIVSCDHG